MSVMLEMQTALDEVEGSVYDPIGGRGLYHAIGSIIVYRFHLSIVFVDCLTVLGTFRTYDSGYNPLT